MTDVCHAGNRGLISSYAQLEAWKPEMWGGRDPTQEEGDQLAHVDGLAEGDLVDAHGRNSDRAQVADVRAQCVNQASASVAENVAGEDVDLPSRVPEEGAQPVAHPLEGSFAGGAVSLPIALRHDED